MTPLPHGLYFHSDDEHAVCHISEFSEEIKDLIRKRLTHICHGKNLAEKGLALHSYKNTLKQFKSRYDNKTEKIRKGMMGELLAHILLYEYFDSFEIASPFFNMEEKSQRKGFDLILTSKSDSEVWITEVKSGETGKKECKDKATKEFLQTAKRDLKLRLNQSEETFWLNAINTVTLALSDCSDYKNAIIKILDDEGILAASNKANSSDNNVILISVLFHATEDLFDQNLPKKVSKDISQESLFKKVIAFSIQKSTYQKIENFLFEEELNDK